MYESLSQFLSHPLVSLLVGSVVTWFCARFYYKKAGDELRTEAARLHQTTSSILYFLDNPKASIKVRRDAAGNPVGLDVIATGSSVATSSAAGVVADGKPHS